MSTPSVSEAILHFNAGWVLWALAALGALGLAVAVERALFFFGIREDVRPLAQRLDQLLASRDYAGALALLARSRSPAAAVAAEGLKHAEGGPQAAEKAFTGAVALERSRLERGLAVLATLGNNAPFVGLFGTVLGVMKAFQRLGDEAAAQSDVTARLVMQGVAQALVATAVGLLVAVPCVAAFNYFQRLTQASLNVTDALCGVVLSHLYAADGGRRGSGAPKGA